MVGKTEKLNNTARVFTSRLKVTLDFTTLPILNHAEDGQSSYLHNGKVSFL